MFKIININYEGIDILLKFIKFIFSLFNFIKVRIDAGELIQDSVIIVNILGNKLIKLLQL
jgi:hypothetical protein